MRTVDLNADLGETVDGLPTADDAAMFAIVSSASIACGGHAGDRASMAAAVRGAVAAGVAIGAHPSYPDRAGFGRVRMSIDDLDLAASLDAQLAELVDVGADVRYVKPHGALYNDVVADERRAVVVAGAIRRLSDRLGRSLPVLGLAAPEPTAIERACLAVGLPFVREAFLDRGYTADGTLVPRSEPGALLDDPAAVARRAVDLVERGAVLAATGETVPIDAASLCLHGDTPAAVAMARAVLDALADAHVTVRAPW